MRRWSSFGRPVRGRRGGSSGSNRSHCRSVRSKRPINRRWVYARPSATPLQTRPSSHAVAHGLAMHGIRAFHISTDPRREILPPETRRYATLDGRNPAMLGSLLDRLTATEAVVLIDGGGGRPDVGYGQSWGMRVRRRPAPRSPERAHR